jgi:hypothetical protein
MRDRESVLRRLEERLSRVSGWLSERRHGGQPGAGDLPARTDALKSEVSRLRRSLGELAHEDLGRARASVEAMGEDYDVPPPRFGLQPQEAEAFRRYLAAVARLEPIISNLDDPRWDVAHEEYERAWDEMERAFVPEGPAASP